MKYEKQIRKYGVRSMLQDVDTMEILKKKELTTDMTKGEITLDGEKYTFEIHVNDGSRFPEFEGLNRAGYQFQEINGKYIVGINTGYQNSMGKETLTRFYHTIQFFDKGLSIEDEELNRCCLEVFQSLYNIPEYDARGEDEDHIDVVDKEWVVEEPNDVEEGEGFDDSNYFTALRDGLD